MTRLYDASDYDARLAHEVVEWQARHNGTRIFLRQEEQRVSFSDTAEMMRRYSDRLRALGFAKGDVLAMMMAPSPDVVLTGLGAARLGGIFVTLNADFRRDYLAAALEDSTARVLVVDADYAERLLELHSWGPVEHVFVKGRIPDGLDARPIDWLADNDGPGTAGDVRPGDDMFVWWSSGTTGKQKGVTHTHCSLMHRGWRGGRVGRNPGSAAHAAHCACVGGADSSASPGIVGWFDHLWRYSAPSISHTGLADWSLLPPVQDRIDSGARRHFLSMNRLHERWISPLWRATL